MARATKPALHGIAGKYAGASVSLEGGPSLLGRDQAAANLVFPPDADSISKRHCTVRWDAARSVFVIEDLGSTNGTFLANGERLPTGQPRDLRPGDRFYIGDMRNQFEVRMEE
jgi:pSer/pThr/pTyr-binding forkhead associated (FHA) protein